MNIPITVLYNYIIHAIYMYACTKYRVAKFKDKAYEIEYRNL